MTAAELVAFEAEVADAFNAGKIRAPVHLSGGNEDRLIEIFQKVGFKDWVFSTWRNHYHALLHGVPRDQVMAAILAGKSMNLCFPEDRFYTSAIVSGILPMALGVAAGIKYSGTKERVWCFVGDMAAMTGIFHEAHRYAMGHDLPITFVIEDNGLSTDTPTMEAWGERSAQHRAWDVIRYPYKRQWPHVNTGKWVNFV